MIEPILDNLLLEPINETETSGIFRPETAKEKPEIGRILAIGKECKTEYFSKYTSANKKFISTWKAIYKKWMATEVKVDGKKYILVAEKDVLGVIK